MGKRILLAASPRQGRTLVSQLRAVGHEVSLVDDLEEARLLLASGHFDHVLLPAAELRDLTERLASFEAADPDAWRRSASGIAHDIRSVLVALRSLLEEASIAPPRPLPDIRQGIARLVDYLYELISELDDSAAAEPGPADIEEVIEAAAVAVYPLASDRRQSLRIDVADSFRAVSSHATHVKRVVANLLQFAAGNAPRSGVVTVRAFGDSEEATLSVSYLGEELSHARLRRIFNPAPSRFTPAQGPLSRAQRIIEGVGGRLWIESERAEGTTVFVSVPRSEVASSPAGRALLPG